MPMTDDEIDQRHAWMSVALRDMPDLDDILDRVCEQAREANRLRETVTALKRARDTAVDAWERHANADERRDPSAPYHDDVRQRIDSARKAGT